MKTLTLFQPWATLVAIGAKRFETRSWGTKYRGPLAIHAGKNKQFASMKSKDYLCDKDPFYSVLMKEMAVAQSKWMYFMPFGAIVAICELDDCFEITGHRCFRFSEQEGAFGDFHPGRYAWRLQNIRKLNLPIEAKGAMGLWEWDEKGLLFNE